MTRLRGLECAPSLLPGEVLAISGLYTAAQSVRLRESETHTWEDIRVRLLDYWMLLVRVVFSNISWSRRRDLQQPHMTPNLPVIEPLDKAEAAISKYKWIARHLQCAESLQTV